MVFTDGDVTKLFLPAAHYLMPDLCQSAPALYIGIPGGLAKAALALHPAGQRFGSCL